MPYMCSHALISNKDDSDSKTLTSILTQNVLIIIMIEIATLILITSIVTILIIEMLSLAV